MFLSLTLGLLDLLECRFGCGVVQYDPDPFGENVLVFDVFFGSHALIESTHLEHVQAAALG